MTKRLKPYARWAAALLAAVLLPTIAWVPAAAHADPPTEATFDTLASIVDGKGWFHEGDRVSAELSAGEITTLLEFPAGPGSDATISYSAHMSLAGFVAAIEEGAQDGDELPPSLTGGVTVIRHGPDGEVAVPAIVRTYTIDWDGDLIADVRTVVAICDGVRQFSATIDSNLLVLDVPYWPRRPVEHVARAETSSSICACQGLLEPESRSGAQRGLRPDEDAPPDADLIKQARKDRIDWDPVACRDPRTITDPVTLVATGDSVTSAHHQWGFGLGKCEFTSADPMRMLTGNNPIWSYAFQYAKLNPKVVEYYNFARTGFTTTLIRSARDTDTDGCDNKWDRTKPPVTLAEAAVRQAKVDGRKAYFVTTGGANNVNWTEALSALVWCRAMEFVNEALPELTTFTWTSGDKTGENAKKVIFPDGGSCSLAITGLDPWTVDVPAYTGPAVYATISDDAAAIVQKMLDAGADKIVWLLYHDIGAAEFDVANLAWGALRNHKRLPDEVRRQIPDRIEPAYVSLVDPLLVAAVRKATNDLNDAIKKKLPNSPKVKTALPAGLDALTRSEIQNTAKGGSPHPSKEGHIKLAKLLDTTYKLIA